MYSYTELQSKFAHSTNLNKTEYKLENNTYVIKANLREDYFVILLHGSQIAVITQDKIILDSCGYRTMTTKDRLNKILDDNQVNYRIYQEHFMWFVYNTFPSNHELQCKFYDGITFIYDYNCKLGNGWILNTE